MYPCITLNQWYNNMHYDKLTLENVYYAEPMVENMYYAEPMEENHVLRRTTGIKKHVLRWTTGRKPCITLNKCKKTMYYAEPLV